jgi:Protein of unknown function (DUF2726)
MDTISSPISLLLCSAVLIAVTAICLFGLIRLIQRTSTAHNGKQQPSSPPATRAVQPQSARSAPKSANSPYAPIAQLLTPAERDFFAALQAATPPGYQIFAQVRLAGLVQIKSWARKNKTHWYRIQAKCVDFVLCDARTTAPRLVVELDDSSHNRADRQARDAFVDTVLADVGLPVLHVRWQSRYSPPELAGRIAEKLGLASPARWVPNEPSLFGTPGASPEQSRRVAAPSRAARSVAAAPSMDAALAIPAAIANSPAEPFVAVPVSYSDPSAATHIACGQCYAAIRPEAKFCSCCGATLTA